MTEARGRALAWARDRPLLLIALDGGRVWRLEAAAFGEGVIAVATESGRSARIAIFRLDE